MVEAAVHSPQIPVGFPAHRVAAGSGYSVGYLTNVWYMTNGRWAFSCGSSPQHFRPIHSTRRDAEPVLRAESAGWEYLDARDVPTGHIPRAKAQGRVKVHAVASASVVGTDVTLNMFMLVPS